MATYRFPLDALHQLRITQRDQARARLGEALHAQVLLEDRVAALAGEIAQLQMSLRTSLSATTFDVNRLLDTQRYELTLKSQLAVTRQQGETLDMEITKRRASLTEADQQVRVLEKLHDRRRQEYEHDQRRREQRELDEIASVQFTAAAKRSAATS